MTSAKPARHQVRRAGDERWNFVHFHPLFRSSPPPSSLLALTLFELAVAAYLRRQSGEIYFVEALLAAATMRSSYPENPRPTRTFVAPKPIGRLEVAGHAPSTGPQGVAIARGFAQKSEMQAGSSKGGMHISLRSTFVYAAGMKSRVSLGSVPPIAIPIGKFT